MNTPELQGQEKRDDIVRLLKLLKTDIEQHNLRSPKRIEILQKLRVHGRKAENADPIYEKEGIQILATYAFDEKSGDVSREGLRCLANALLLEKSTRQTFVDLGNGIKAVQKLKEDNSDDEFLASRLLFLTTYDSDLDFDKLFDNYALADSINNHIARHAKQFSKSKKKMKLTQIDELALSETLKLIFNITNYYPHRVAAFSPSIPHILQILSRIEIPSSPLQAPINYLINALLNLDLENKKLKHFVTNPLFPKFDQNCNVDKLINILDQAVAMYRPAQLESLAVPLLSLLRKIYEIAPDGARKYIEWLLLPDDDERDRPIGQSNTLSSRLLRLSTSPVAPSLRENISSFMFELSGSNANDFVRNVGYGFASGFLMTHDLAIPESAKEAFSNSAQKPGEFSTTSGINPVTGQRLDSEPQDTGSEMTQEEKEQEAERLFVLFERLRATRVVAVENPVRKAANEGRLQEIDDTDEDS